jgi:hypothetical protein
LVAESESALLVGTRTIACARRGERRAAHQAAAASITRIVTRGRVASPRHGWSSTPRCLGASLAR